LIIWRNFNGFAALAETDILRGQEDHSMQNMGNTGESCPFEFNFDPATFKVGDMISYRVPDALGDFPFVGTILAVFADYIEISPNDPTTPDKRMRATRESRPIVAAAEAL
jgi:hypothetical protein